MHAARPGHLVVRVGGRGPQRVEYALQPVTADLCVQGPMPQQSDPAAGKQGVAGQAGVPPGVVKQMGGQVRCDAA